MQFFLELVSQSWKKKSITSCRSLQCFQKIRCSLDLLLSMVWKQSMESMQRVEPSSTSCSSCKPKKVARQAAKRACYTLEPTCNLSHNVVATQIVKKIVPCRCRFRLHFSQRLQGIFKPLQVAARDYALINRECGPYAKIFVMTSCRTDRTKWGPCGMTSQQIFSVWTKLKVNKSFIVYPHK